jgi:hypothetical protein
MPYQKQVAAGEIKATKGNRKKSGGSAVEIAEDLIMGPITRAAFYLRGHRMVRLCMSPRAGGYIFVNSPDLPGFSMMLKPGELDSFDSFVAAIAKPLEAFVTAEYQASRNLRDDGRVRIRGMQKATESKIYADMCLA